MSSAQLGCRKKGGVTRLLRLQGRQSPKLAKLHGDDGLLAHSHSARREVGAPVSKDLARIVRLL